MTYQMRAITPDEFPAFLTAVRTGFNDSPPSAEEIAAERRWFEFDRSLVTFDGSQIAGTAGLLSFTLTLPGDVLVPAAGVGYVTVAPTYRRRGIMRMMMQRLVDDARARGESLAILHASESAIYGRFGFGVATSELRLEIETRYATLAVAPVEQGQVVMLDRGRAALVLPTLYDQARRRLVGAIDRSPSWWDIWLSDPERWRGDYSSRFYLAYEAQDGTMEGYATYRVKRQWEHGLPNHTLLLGDLITLTPRARAALWNCCLTLDLISTVQTSSSPVDEPLRWMLTDPRRLRVTRLADGMWLRILDVQAALSVRRYATTDRLVLEVSDLFLPEVAGTYELTGSPDGGACRRASQTADLQLAGADLGAAFLGGVRFSTLANAGRVRELTPGALRRADAMFSCEPAPWATTDF